MSGSLRAAGSASPPSNQAATSIGFSPMAKSGGASAQGACRMAGSAMPALTCLPGPASLASRALGRDGGIERTCMAVEAVIWDFGGVFTTSPFEAFNRYEAAHGVPKDLI